MTTRTPFPALKRPLVAILRGLRPTEALDCAGALIEEGFEAVEVPLNSPDAFSSIAAIVREFGDRALIGAGTVLEPEDVTRLADIGATLVVTPNTCPAVIGRAAEAGMVTMPGVFTPSEALLAWKSGASALKFFPASVLGPGGIAAIRAILKPEAPVAAVGGVSETNYADYMAKGVQLFGLGGSLYKPGMTAAELRDNARRSITAYDAAARD